MTKLAPALWGIPTVNSSTDRDLLFPSPAVGQKVENLGTGARERWTGSAWTAVASAGTASVNDTRSTPIAMVQQLNASGYAIFGIDRASTARVSALRYSLSNADEWFVGMLYNGGSASTLMAWSYTNALANAAMSLTNDGILTLAKGPVFGGDPGFNYSIGKNAGNGVILRLGSGSSYDLGVYDPTGVLAFAVPAGTRNLQVQGGIIANAGIAIAGGSFGAGNLYKDATFGLVAASVAGSSYDFTLFTPGGSSIFRVPTGTPNVQFVGLATLAGGLTISAGTFTLTGYGGGTGIVGAGAVDSGGAGFRVLRVPN